MQLLLVLLQPQSLAIENIKEKVKCGCGLWTPLNPFSFLIQNEHFVGKNGDERQKEDKYRFMHPTKQKDYFPISQLNRAESH